MLGQGPVADHSENSTDCRSKADEALDEWPCAAAHNLTERSRVRRWLAGGFTERTDLGAEYINAVVPRPTEVRACPTSMTVKVIAVPDTMAPTQETARGIAIQSFLCPRRSEPVA